MLSESDLEKIKGVARILLMTEVHETEFSPAVVQHPFTATGIAYIPQAGELQFVDITQSEVDLKLWQDFMSDQISKAKNIIGIYSLINKPYGLTFLKYARPFLSKSDFSKILCNAWMRSENPNMDPNLTKTELLKMFRSADPATLMTDKERKCLKELDDEVTVYRGITDYNAKNVKALSWTLNRGTAKWFATRFGQEGKVYEAQIEKKHILALFLGRGEDEVIVDPKYLQELKQESLESLQLTQ